MSRPTRFMLSVLCVSFLVCFAACRAERSPSERGMARTVAQSRPGGTAVSPLSGSRQLILVVAADWNANQGRLRRFARQGNGPWRPVGDEIPVTLGKNGLAWGLGLHGAALSDGPLKVEGDGRSPAGVFTFANAFAYNPEELWHPTKMPMHRITSETVCVETIGSKAYNRMLDENPATPHDWDSPDRMLRPDGLYRYGLFVNHNAPRTKPGAGSCIFMHLWRRPGAPTAGCTAMNQAAMQVLLGWLDPAQKPVLVQLPRRQLDRWAPAWGAPELVLPPQRNDQ